MADVTSSSTANDGKKSKKDGNKNSKNPHHQDMASAMDIRDPDAFQDTLIDGWSWVEKHAALVGGVFAIGIVLLSIYSLRNWWSTRTEHKAQDAYYAAEAKFTQAKDGFDRAKMKAQTPPAATDKAADKTKDDKNTDHIATGDIDKDYGSKLTDLEKVAHDFAGTTAGTQAALLVTDTYLSYDKPDRAVEVAQFAASHTSDKSLLGALVRVQLGTALASKNDCKEAVKSWGQVIDNKSFSYLHADASLRSGLCFEKMGELPKALEMYQKASADSGAGPGAESPTASTAKGFMRALELKLKTTQPAKAS